MFDNSFGYKGHRVDIEVTQLPDGQWRWSFHVDGENRSDLSTAPLIDRERALMSAADAAKLFIDAKQ